MTASQKYEPVSASPGLQESFVAKATAVNSPTAIAEPYLEVVAPATLPEVSLQYKYALNRVSFMSLYYHFVESQGYTFEAEVNGRTCAVTVPMV